MKDIFIQSNENLDDFFSHILPELALRESPQGHPLQLIQRPGSLKICHGPLETIIYYQEKAHLFRALTLWLHEDRPVYILEEHPHFEAIGPMIDLSRNAVMTVEKLQRVILLTSKMGLNRLMLYMEDTYEIPEYPYFGHLRGRYTQVELKKLDSYAQSIGVTLIPAIQTLAHLTNPLKWGFAKNIRDTEDILLVGEEETYTFLEAAIRSIRSCFTTDQLHIGMDEAHQLGKGKYLVVHGLKDRFSIMAEHLQRVAVLCQNVGFKPMMWSDMFFRIGAPTGDYYDPDVCFPTELFADLPAVKMVYWDYYHNDYASYQRMFAKHRELKQPIVFAGGIWTWNGLAPNYGKSFATMRHALQAAKENDVQEVYATLWGDDGAETPLIAALLGLQYFSEAQFGNDLSLENLTKKFQLFHQSIASDFLLLDRFDQTAGVPKNNPHGENPSKLLLYQDLLYGLYHENLTDLSLASHYQALAQELAAVKATRDTQTMFAFYQQLADVLAQKACITNQITSAYKSKDRSGLRQAVDELSVYKSALQSLYEAHRQVWFDWNRPFGFESIDLRYGALLMRCDTTRWRLTAFLDGELDTLEELTQPSLPMVTPFSGSTSVGRNLFHGIYSAGKISDV